VGLVLRVDRPAELGTPELDAVVGEQRQREAELVAVEGSVWFADHNGNEPRCGSRSAARRRLASGRRCQVLQLRIFQTWMIAGRFTRFP
jgi:hypothetical protein